MDHALIKGVCISGRPSLSRAEQRIDDLLHRLRKEAAVCEGAKNMVRILQPGKKTDLRVQGVSETSQP